MEDDYFVWDFLQIIAYIGAQLDLLLVQPNLNSLELGRKNYSLKLRRPNFYWKPDWAKKLSAVISQGLCGMVRGEEIDKI